MTSGDQSSLRIPGAWVSKESVLDSPLTVPLTPPSTKRTTDIRPLESPAPLTSRDPPPPSSTVPMIVIYSTPRASYRAVALSRPERNIKEATFAMHFSSKKAAKATPQVSDIESIDQFPG